MKNSKFLELIALLKGQKTGKLKIKLRGLLQFQVAKHS